MRSRNIGTVLESLPDIGSPLINYQVRSCTGVVNNASFNLRCPYRPLKWDYSVMWDELGRESSHPCRHYKTTVQLNTGSGGFVRPDGAPGVAIYSSADYRYDTYGWYTVLADIYQTMDIGMSGWGIDSPPGWTIQFPGIDETKVYNDLRAKVIGTVADHGLNIIEAEQLYGPIVSLAGKILLVRRNWQGIRQLYRDVAASLRKVKKTWRKDSFRRAVALGVANSHLSWKFGWSPFLQDLKATMDYIPKYKRDLANYTNDTPVHASRVFKGLAKHVQDPRVHYSLNGYPIYTSHIDGFSVDTVERRYSMTATVNRRVLGPLFEHCDLLVSRFSSSPASLAWELIPFSFVSDWVLDIRGLLQKIDDCVRSDPIKETSYTRTEKAHLVTQVYSGMFSPCDGSQLQDELAVTIDHKLYARAKAVKGQLVTSSLRFGKSQAALTASLIVQKLAFQR